MNDKRQAIAIESVPFLISHLFSAVFEVDA